MQDQRAAGDEDDKEEHGNEKKDDDKDEQDEVDEREGRAPKAAKDPREPTQKEGRARDHPHTIPIVVPPVCVRQEHRESAPMPKRSSRGDEQGTAGQHGLFLPDEGRRGEG